MSTLAWLMRSTALMIIVGTLKDKMIEMNFHIIPFMLLAGLLWQMANAAERDADRSVTGPEKESRHGE